MRYSIDTECVCSASLAMLELNASYFCKTFQFADPDTSLGREAIQLAYPDTSSGREANFDD